MLERQGDKTVGKALLVGCMEPRKGDSSARALFVCAADGTS